ELAVRELMAHHHLVHRERQGPGEMLDELPVLAFVRMLEQIAPQWIGYGPDLLVGLVDDVHAGLGVSGRHGFSGARHGRHCDFPPAATVRLTDPALSRLPEPGDSTAPSPSCTRRSPDRGAKPSARASSRRPLSSHRPGSNSPASGSPCETACAASRTRPHGGGASAPTPAATRGCP